MKLFGSRNALLKEKKRQMEARTWIIHPCSNFRLYWDLLMLIFLITNLIVLPVSIAFFYDDVGLHWIVFNITCDTMFILDILINFRTGLIDPESHGHVILDPKVIALRYVKTWFVVDFISSLPLDYVFLGLDDQPYSAGRALRILRLAKLLQLLRLLRISRLVRYVRLWKEFFSLASIVVKLFNLICVMVLMGHWSGCIQFFVPVIQGLPEDSWIVLNGLQTATWWEQYSKALFKALSHMLCIGYGEFPPRNMTDTWLTIASMLAGATCYALFIGHATTLIQSFDTSSRQFRDHLQQVNEYMIYRKLPGELRRRITDYYEHRFGGKLFNEAAILSEISDCLRKDVIQHNCKELVRSVPFFLKADESFVTDVITKLQFEMFQPSDIIIKEGTKGDRMFFIQEGLIEILTDEGKIVTRLGDGSYFGEICLLTKKCRTATVRAASYCNLFSLSKEHFDKILENYPLMRRTLETIAAKRLHKLGKDPNLVTSRESLLDDINGIQKVFEGSDDDSCDDSEQGSSPTLSRESNSQFLTVVRSFFTKDSEEFSPSSRAPSMKSGISPSQALPRCKSALNNTLNHLIMVPQSQSKTKLGRAKSAADVADNSTFLSQRLFAPGDETRSSCSPGKKRRAKDEKLGTHNSSTIRNKVKKGHSQPGSPRAVISERAGLTASANNVCKYPVMTPQLLLTAQSNSTIAMPEEEFEERVKFVLSEEV
ncbi:potassium/sodium hyperpolarization-activated cyclic nucleotide-gated channel 1-like [Watersipora subatra]|uniref:potassium/sodium hyperpolarization-activated cyclic nucleotide-gated channel 1-like n=1 Tax=Watersipora subatra TaxID=2589382 RepID=UPI00355C3427